MPTIMSHAAVPIAAAIMLGRGAIPVPVIAVAIVVAMLPDADVIGFRFGVEYAHSWGHRGATHSLFLAAVMAIFVVLFIRPLRWRLSAAVVFLAMASHGFLDTLTNGGLGAALWWPIDGTRVFAPFTPIKVSPIGIKDFLSERGLRVLASEALWIWLPLTTTTLLVLGIKKLRLYRIELIDTRS